jgi:hypothetical protein
MADNATRGQYGHGTERPQLPVRLGPAYIDPQDVCGFQQRGNFPRRWALYRVANSRKNVAIWIDRYRSLPFALRNQVYQCGQRLLMLVKVILRLGIGEVLGSGNSDKTGKLRTTVP